MLQIHLSILFAMRLFLKITLLTALALTLACSPKNAAKTAETPVKPEEPVAWEQLDKPLVGEDEMSEDSTVEVNLDDLMVTPEYTTVSDSLAPYNPSHTFEIDLLHTAIDIAFDWAKKRATGKATLSMKPWFYPVDHITLDAKNFDIQSVSLADQSVPLKYDYNGMQIKIQLDKSYTRKEEFKIAIQYTAKPDERESFGGSAAISSDKGLYFINPDGSDPTKPKQIWTQGETESNSYWFPTVDKPNERCTEEMRITVEDKYKTLSNGVLVNSRKNADGTRTDYWKMDKPHAPYLFMMAVGEYAVVKDRWRNIDVDYYVEPKYEPYARDIFNYTPEMLEFFSNKLDYPYPWAKYSQIIVRDYVSGAMENTTAVIFGEFMQKTKRELLDDHLTNEKVVAHEMFHHWFGDLVTTENWANLTMNEGFANYSEYLWLEHKYGRDEADQHEYEEQQGYIFSAMDGGHPLINYGYVNREDMFDAHSYNKGGAVLHMLRQEVGDEAFWAALHYYLTKNQYTEVEADELRLAFEDVTGRDLHWFWNQWYFDNGHPSLVMDYQWDEATKMASVTIEQKQETGRHVFELPISVDIYGKDGSVRREKIRLTKRKEVFSFPCAAQPALMNVDAEKTLLCVKEDHHTEAEWAFMAQNAPLFRDRLEAIEGLQANQSEVAQNVYNNLLKDKFYGIRARVLGLVDIQNPTTLETVRKIAETEKEPALRAAAIQMLGTTGDAQYTPMLQQAINEQNPYSVVGAALSTLVRLDSSAALKASKSIQNDESESIIMALADLYAQIPNRDNLAFFEGKLDKMDYMPAFSFFENYQKLLVGLKDDALIEKGVEAFKAISLNSSTGQFRRLAATKAIADIRNFYREAGNNARVEPLNSLINAIKEKETDPTLKMYYDMF